MASHPYWSLSKLDLFVGVDEDELKRELGRGAELSLRKIGRRERWSIEDRGEWVYGVSEGLVKVLRVSRSGREVVDTLLRMGDLFGRIASEGPKIANVMEGLTDCTILCIRAERLREYLRQRPELMLTAMQLVEDRERRLSRRVESLVFKDVYVRVVETLLQLTVDIPETCKYGMAVDVRVTQSDLAALVGASRQAVNRVLRSLEMRDVLHRHDGVLCVPDVARLARAAEEG